MKTLTDFTKEQTSLVMSRWGAFFAFSKEQLDKQAKEGVEYADMGLGMVCPSHNAKLLRKELDEAYIEGIKADKKAHSPRQIILRELYNYECFYTGDISEAVAALSDYGKQFDWQHVAEVYGIERCPPQFDKQPSFSRGCLDKIPLKGNLRAAKKRAEKLAQKHGHQLGLYRCPHCGRIHTTTKVGNAWKYELPLLYVTKYDGK